MTRRTYLLADAASITCLTALLLVAASLLNGCGCEKGPEPGPPIPIEVTPKEEPVEEPKEAVAEPQMGAVRPVTFEVLKLMPESAAVAVAIPSLTNVYDKGVAFAKRVVPEGVELDAKMAEVVAEMAGKTEVAGAESFADIVRAKGFDPDRPMALFIDVGPLVAGLKEAAEVLEEQRDEGEEGAPAEAEPEGSEAKETAPEEPAPEGGEVEESALAQPAPEGSETTGTGGQATPFAPFLNKSWAALGLELQPAMACVAACLDPGLAETTIKEFIAAHPALSAEEVEDVEASGMTIHSYGAEVFSYFLSGDLVVMGNNLAFVKEVAARLEDPAEIRYGTTECPAAARDEIVELVRMDKVMLALRDVLPVLASLNPQMATMVTMQTKSIEDAIAAYSDSDDPLVVTLEWTEEKLEILSRIDLGTHPSLLAISGKATPLRLARLLPERTLALMSLRLTPEAKARMREQWSGAVPPGLQESPAVAMQVGMIQGVMDTIGDEVSLGITGAQEGLPTAIAIVDLANVDQAKGLLMSFGLGAPGAEPVEIYNGVDIWAVGRPVPTPIQSAIAGDRLVAANDPAQLKTLIDLIQSGGTTALFESLEPPLDPAVPRYGAFLLKAELLSEVIVPVVERFQGEAGPGPKSVIDKVLEVFRELRMTQDVVNNWQQSRVIVYLKAPSG